jgi:fructosamine-3-kinase
MRTRALVVFDPAVRCPMPSRAAMMELFGAPPAGFWPAYRDSAGLAPGYARRRGLYQLYHLLNHELLFGGYARTAMEVIDALL